MTNTAPAAFPMKQAALSIISLAGGASLAVIPAATVSIASRIYSVAEQGVVAVAVMAATFTGQLAFAVIVESRLSSAGTTRRVVFPRWLGVLAIVAVVAVVVAPRSFVVLCVCLPVLLAALEVGRGVSVAERLDIREMWAAVSVGVGALAGVAAAFSGAGWAIIPLVVGIAGATVIRSASVQHVASRPEPRVMGWVVTDVAITGGIYPAMNALILALLGPVPAVLFTSISTVSGLLAIPLNFMRLRLLKEHSRLDIVISSASVLVAILAIAGFEFAGVFDFVFGHAWTVSATAVPLGIACLWRAASLATTIPFAALRRMGRAKVLTLLRAAATVATFAGALGAIATQNLVWIFTVLLAGELLQAFLYALTLRRVRQNTGV